MAESRISLDEAKKGGAMSQLLHLFKSELESGIAAIEADPKVLIVSDAEASARGLRWDRLKTLAEQAGISRIALQRGFGFATATFDEDQDEDDRPAGVHYWSLTVHHPFLDEPVSVVQVGGHEADLPAKASKIVEYLRAWLEATIEKLPKIAPPVSAAVTAVPIERWLENTADFSVGVFASGLETVLGDLCDLESENPYSDADHEHNKRLHALNKACIRSLGVLYEKVELLPPLLENVWSPPVPMEIADMRLALDILRNRMRGARANGWDHPVPRKPSAPQAAVEEWQEKERYLWRMVKRLRSLAVVDGPKPKPPVVVEETPREKTDWMDVQQRLMVLYDRAEKYTSTKTLADRIDCSTSTIDKAFNPKRTRDMSEAEWERINSNGDKLRGWRARSAGEPPPRATGLNDFIADHAKQTQEVDPHAALEANETEETFNRLVQEAAPEVRAKLNALQLDEIRKMSPEEVRQMVELIADDPDEGRRVFGRKL